MNPTSQQPAASSQQPAASSQQPVRRGGQPAATPESRLVASTFLNNFEQEREQLIETVGAVFSKLAKSDTAAIADAVSEAVAALYIEERCFETQPALRAWLKRVATNQLLNTIKHAEYSVRIEDIEEEPCCEDEALAHQAERFDSHKLMLACLNVHERSVIMIHQWLDLSFEEMAKQRIDGMTAATLRKRYNRAMKKLVAFVKKHEKYFW